jgi:hydrogenase-4 component E
MTPFMLILFGLTMLYIGVTSRVEAYIKALAAQGIILFVLVLLDFENVHILNMLFILFETLVIKGVFIPFILFTVVRKNNIFREIEPNIPFYFSLFMTSMIFALGFYITYITVGIKGPAKPLYFGISISTIVTGFVVIMTRKKIITHVMGYIIIENGIFLLTLSLAKEMPFIVSLGVLLDIFIGIYLLGLFVNKIQDTFSGVNISSLTKLKD